ncbi:hypothetical protein [Novosphingobium humi]|uniref:Uncharacterized protein n=1 Tax=Novosphingobium humi TaxID=2282397 RepID=A0ABY7TZC2_9SPHN|nr:hypothetical protein [Novosphingobium humi]WCT78634.1 hypothetical protein PQ457_06640 [Novosphingobium humi]
MARGLGDIRPHWLRRAIVPMVGIMLCVAIFALYAAGTLLVAIWAALRTLGEGPVKMIDELRYEIIPAMRSAWRGERP